MKTDEPDNNVIFVWSAASEPVTEQTDKESWLCAEDCSGARGTDYRKTRVILGSIE